MCSCYERLMKPQAFQLANRIKSHARHSYQSPPPRPCSQADGSLLANLRQKLRQATPSQPHLHPQPVVRFMCCDEFWRRFCRAAIHLMTEAPTHTDTHSQRGCLRATSTPLGKVQLFKFQGCPTFVGNCDKCLTLSLVSHALAADFPGSQ